MKTSVIGTGKTGSEVVRLLGDDVMYQFDIDNKPVRDQLAESDAVIIFVPGDGAEDILDTVLDSGVSAVWATTGYEWPENLADLVREQGARWVLASNFSLGMNVIRKCLDILGRGSDLLKNPEFHIHEVHHTDKKDAPSGTALSWKEWLGKNEVRVTSAREGDIKGIHSLHVKTEYESIYLKHEAHDRAVFAEGAIWAANYLYKHPDMSPGLYSFEEIIDKVFKDTV